jgi:4-hydroxy-3-polyprenylbenzoate decarboxylase
VSTADASKRVVVGVTGASGSLYAARLLHHLRTLGFEVHLVASDVAEQVCRFEGHPLPQSVEAGTDGLPGSVIRHRDDNLFAPPSSGSFRHRGMVLVPCSAGTAGRIAAGTAETLLLRSADVCLKENLPLVVVLRESPLSRIHLRNLLELSDAGAKIVPASPGFYHKPQTFEELADGLLSRVLDLLGIEANISPRWTEND